MAMIFMDSFKHYATADLLLKYQSMNAGSITSGGRNGGNCLSSPSQLYRWFVSTATTFTWGCAIKITVLSGTQTFYVLGDDASQGTQYAITNTGAITANCHSVTLGTSSTLLSTGTWYYIECQTLVNSSTGQVIVRVNGSNILNVTNVDTKGLTSGTMTNFEIGATGGIGLFSDLYFNDNTGTRNNTFLGDTRVDASVAEADSIKTGFNHGLTPSTGTDHGAMVDDNPADGDTTYNHAATALLKDSYIMTAPGGSSSVSAVQTAMYIRKTDQGTKTFTDLFRIAGVDYPGSTGATALATPATYMYAQLMYDTNPASGLGWTGSNVAAMESGMQILT